MLTLADAENRMLFLEQEYGHGKDEEEFHREADELMCELLVELGYENVVDIFERNPKWWS